MKKKTLLQNSLSRRDTLKLMGAAGATSFLGWGKLSALIPGIAGAPGAVGKEELIARIMHPALYSAAPVSFTKQVSEMSCVARPALTEGPFFVEEKLNRSDIRPDPSNGTVKTGTKLTLKFNVFRTSGTVCTPLSGAYVDIWHTDASGAYSDVNGQGNPRFC